MTKHIAQVMQDTAGNYGAKHFFYNQAFHKWEGNPTGVCLAMCKIWLREITKTETHALLWISQELDKHTVEIDKKQTKDMIRIREGREPKTLKHTWDEAEKPQDWIVSRALYNLTTEPKENFWPRAASVMASLEPREFSALRKNLICLGFGPTVGHAVAACKNGGLVYFFDPNGGVLQFDDEFDLESWLIKEFPNADADHYHEIQLVTVYDYKK